MEKNIYNLTKKLLTGLIILLLVCLSACGETANNTGNESMDSAEIEEHIFSESDVASNGSNSTELDISLPDDYSPLYLDGNELELVSAAEAGDINVYTYSLDNFGWREKNMLFCKESDDIESDYIAYALDGSSLVKAEKTSFEFALNYDRFYSLDTVLPDDAYKYKAVDTMVMDLYRYKALEVYYYIDNGNDMGFSPVKINEEKLLLYHHGMGWPIDYYEYDLSDGTVKDILKELGTPEESVASAVFSEDMGSMLFSCCEVNGDIVYYYADLDKNEYIKVKDVFDIEVNYFDKLSGLEKESKFIWAEADTYMIIVMTDNGYSIYRCDFAEKIMELVKSKLKMADVIKCEDGRHGDCIMTVDAEGRLEVYRPAENKTAALEGKAYGGGYVSYVGSCCEYDNIIAFDKNGPDALSIDWDKGITGIGDTNVRNGNFLRDGNNIYVFQ